MKIILEKAESSDAAALLAIQKQAFQPLYKIYNDENNPCLHKIDGITQRINRENGAYYKIFADEILCGGIMVTLKSEGLYRINIVYILPEYQSKGIGQEAVRLAENLHKEAREWELDFPVDLVKNKICYEKSGYTDKGIREVVNEKLTLAHYHKFAPNFKLVFPQKTHKDIWQKFLSEFDEKGEKIIPFAARIGDGSFEDFLKLTNDFANNNLPEDMSHFVPASTYFLLYEKENKILGCVNIRHKLNDHLLNAGGNIGYGVCPSERRKGCATIMLSLALDKCRLLGIERALVTCNRDNTASAKTIAKNGGVFENNYVEEDGNVVERYWIELKRS